MKCSDCKSFKLCVLNPDAEDADPETFGCLEFSANNDIKHDTPTRTGRNWRVTAHILFWLGVIGITASLILIGEGWPGPGDCAEDLFEYLYLGVFFLIISLFVVFVGAMMGVAERRYERRCLESHDTRNSDSDHNKTVKKLRL